MRATILLKGNRDDKPLSHEPLKAARGHATSYNARTDSIVLSVTKN